MWHYQKSLKISFLMFVIVIHRVKGRHNTHKFQSPFSFLEHKLSLASASRSRAKTSFQTRITFTNDTGQERNAFKTLQISSFCWAKKHKKSRKERREVNFFGSFHFHNLFFHFTVFVAAIKTVMKVNKWENENRVYYNNLIFDVLFILWRLWTCWQQRRMGNSHIWSLKTLRRSQKPGRVEIWPGVLSNGKNCHGLVLFCCNITVCCERTGRREERTCVRILVELFIKFWVNDACRRCVALH